MATRLSPNAAHLHNEYASAYQMAGDSSRALDQFLISLRIDPRYVETYRRLGDFYRNSNQEDEAIRTYEQGLLVAPRDVALRSLLGFLYAERGETDKAIEQNLAVLDSSAQRRGIAAQPGGALCQDAATTRTRCATPRQPSRSRKTQRIGLHWKR